MKRASMLVCACIFICLFSACSTNTTASNEIDIAEIVNEYEPEIINQLYSKGVIASLIEDDPHLVMEYINEKNGYPDMALLLDEAEGNAEAIKMLFDFTEEIGYWPSAIFGKYIYDVDTHTIHLTDSDCLTNIPYENIRCLWSFLCFTLEDINREIIKHPYLSQYEWTFCPVCIGNKE